VLPIYGGSESNEHGRLTMELRQHSGDPVTGARVTYTQNYRTQSGGVIGTSALFPPTDTLGAAVLHNACTKANATFTIEASDSVIALAFGKWTETCARSQRIVAFASRW